MILHKSISRAASQKSPAASLQFVANKVKMATEVLANSARENIPIEASPAKPAKIPRMDIEPLKVKKLSEFAVLPKRGSAGAAGYDLSRFVVDDLTLERRR